MEVLMKQTSGITLERLIQRLSIMKNQAPKAAALGAMLPLRKQVAKSFSQQKDPDGSAWAPLKYKKLLRGHKILEGLKDYFSFWAYGPSVKVSNRKYYTTYHHTGTKYMARRGFLPESNKKVDEQWAKPIRVGAQKSILRLLKRGGV